MCDEPLRQEDFEVFVHYGKATLGVQQLELASLKRLARLVEPKLPEDVSFERAWNV